MPYASDAQRKYFNANREKLESEGVNVAEYNEASKGMKLPEHAKQKAKKAHAQGRISDKHMRKMGLM